MQVYRFAFFIITTQIAANPHTQSMLPANPSHSPQKLVYQLRSAFQSGKHEQITEISARIDHLIAIILSYFTDKLNQPQTHFSVSDFKDLAIAQKLLRQVKLAFRHNFRLTPNSERYLDQKTEYLKSIRQQMRIKNQ